MALKPSSSGSPDSLNSLAPVIPGFNNKTSAPVTTSVPIPRIPAFGISLAGSCASSAASGSSSIPKKNHIANGIAATIGQIPNGRKDELPASGAMLVRLSNENLPLKIAITEKMARTASAINETTIENLKESAVPEIFSSKKIT